MSASSKTFSVRGEIWLYPGKAGWHFLTLDKKTAANIRSFVNGDCSAWGSVRVTVKVRAYTWETSIFPDRKLGSYLLPIKKQARKDLGLSEGMRLSASLTVQRDDDFADE